VTLHLDLNTNQSNGINNDQWLCCHLIGWHSNPGAQSQIIVHVTWLADNQIQVQSHRSLLMSFDWLAFKSRTLHLDLNASQSNDINNDLWLCTWIWMSANQMTLTMMSDSAPGFEYQPIKIWLVGIEIQVQSQGSLLMSFDWLTFKFFIFWNCTYLLFIVWYK
jgi:hypothetical protein